MNVKINGKNVDVCHKDCPKQECFHLGQDKGTFVQGRGYTSYHKTPLWVCMTRHLHGCPEGWLCPEPCNTIMAPPNKKCRWCGKTREEVEG